jgi:ketosteroid isomerase-like protein
MTAKEIFYEAMRRTDAGDQEGFLEMFADDCHWVVPGAEFGSKEELRGWLTPFWQGFSTFRHDIHRAVSDTEDEVFAEGTWTGTHDGVIPMPDGEVPPTGRDVSFRFAIVATRDPNGEQARSVNLYFDNLEFLGQLGVLPEGGTIAA